jgi:uncharacterized protein YlxP (DUF503 family)
VHAAALRIELYLRGCRSLKAKRAAIRPVIEGLYKRHRVSVAEVGHHDAWHRTTLGVAAVASSPSHLGEILDHVEQFVWSFPEVEVLRIDRLWLEQDEEELR